MNRTGRPGSADRRRSSAAPDAVIVGSGVAGLSAALALAPRRVLLVTKTALGDGASRWAQGGVAAAVGPGDRPELHARDTMTAGAGLCDPEVVAALTAEGPERVAALIGWGARFDRDSRGRLRLGREGAHGRRRVLHADGDATGAEIVRALVAAVLAADHVEVLERTFAEDLLLDGHGRVSGVRVRPALQEPPDPPVAGSGGSFEVVAPAVVLATGGLGRLFLHTTNPREATGDGLAMAARAGAVLADLEMIQFHPTALAVGADPLPLVTEALRGEGAVLRDDGGRRFVADVDPRAELAPRDVVARAIWELGQRGGTARLDATGAVGDAFPERFPTVWAACRAHGLDPRTEAIPVTPAAHYAMAGVATDGRGRTSVPGLWACGEVASSGVHGANRLASNSLLEGLVFGARVGADVVSAARARRSGPSDDAPVGPGQVIPAAGPRPAATAASSEPAILHRLRRRMWSSVGLVRTEAGLLEAAAELADLQAAAPTSGEVANLALLGRLVTAAALAREESRGAHFRGDHPEADPASARRLFWRYAPEAGMLPLAPAPEPSGWTVGAERAGGAGDPAPTAVRAIA